MNLPPNNSLNEQVKDTTIPANAGQVLDEVMAASGQAEKAMTLAEKAVKNLPAKKKKNKAKIIKPNPFAIIRKFIADKLPSLIRNEITTEIELEGVPQSEQALNSHYINLTAEAEGGETVKQNDWITFINSEHIPTYNPFADYLQQNVKPETGNIDHLIQTLELDSEGLSHELVAIIIKKWLVGLVAGLFNDNYNPLVLVLIGLKGTGKTEFFRRLLPDELKKYFAESKLDAGKDDEAKACENLLLFIDEMDFLTKKEASEIRRFISQNYFSYRPPYGRKNVKRKRIASFCGASNEVQIINDCRNNRRIIPIMITDIRQDDYNAIDKDALLREAYQLYKSGQSWDLTQEEIKALDEAAGINAIPLAEEELLTKYFTHGEGFYTSSGIAAEISRLSGVRLSSIKMGKALAAHGFNRKKKSVNGNSIYGWLASPCDIAPT